MLRSRPSSAFAVRVVSYNVLSSHLASPSHFTTVDPVHLEASNRLPLVLKKLEEEITTGQNNVIVCLQEVSHDWAAQFHVWFANRGYHLVTGLYGKKFNGYMGVALAYPTHVYETIDMDISRLSDKRVDGWPVEPEVASTSAKVWKGVRALWEIPMRTIGMQSMSEPDHWSISERRFNILLTATLKDKTSGTTFCIANYHMPCCYYAPMVMTIHSEMAVRHVQNVAAAGGAAASHHHDNTNTLPFVLAGDWNITPDSATYKLLTTGMLDNNDESYPTPKYDMEWTPNIEPMKSAYAVASLDGKEPDFTNYARIQDNDDPFIDTLDYIFLSNEWKVKGVKEIVHRDDANGPFPNAEEPSDHILIAADLELSTS